jgi:tetratricopeptide (TPR) repeat protein
MRDRPAVRSRPLRAHLLGLAALICTTACPLAGKAADCDPAVALNDKAKLDRLAHNYDAAEQSIQAILKNRPDDFRANYTQALITLNRAAASRLSLSSGIDRLIVVSNMLPAQDPACAKAKNFYSIYMIIGVEYYGQGDLVDAQKYFVLADAHRDMLDDDTRANLIDDLGLIQLRLVHDSACAAEFFRRAQAAGARKAAGHLALALRIVAAAGEREGCPKADR